MMTESGADNPTEAVITGTLRFAAKPHFDWVRDLAAKHDGRAARLYYVTPGLSIAVTVVCGAASWRASSSLYESRVSPDLLGIHPLPSDRAAAFFDGLLRLGAWTLPECEVNARDGFMCYHAIAESGKEYAFRMGNCNLHSDPRFVGIVNLYSAEFLGGSLTMKHSPPVWPEWLFRGGRNNVTLHRTGAEMKRPWSQRLFGRGAGR